MFYFYFADVLVTVQSIQISFDHSLFVVNNMIRLFLKRKKSTKNIHEDQADLAS